LLDDRGHPVVEVVAAEEDDLGVGGSEDVAWPWFVLVRVDVGPEDLVDIDSATADARTTSPSCVVMATTSSRPVLAAWPLAQAVHASSVSASSQVRRLVVARGVVGARLVPARAGM
jgi:hypothetical protein